MKKTILFLGIFLMPQIPAWAYDFEEEGIYYDITAPSEAAVTRESASGENSYSGEVVIPATVSHEGTAYNVTAVGSYAFSGSASLTSVTIGENVTQIGTYAFASCKALSSVAIGSNVTLIDNYAFNSCSSLQEAKIPDNVAYIGYYAFKDCSSLSTLTLGSGLSEIGNYAFSSCTALEEAVIPDNVVAIDSNAFKNCSSLSRLTLGSGLTDIGSFAFSGCSSLEEINSLCEIPPTIYSLTFQNVDKGACVLNVPVGCSERYSQTIYWKEFANIAEVDFSGYPLVDADSDPVAISCDGGEILVKGDNIPVYVYNLKGALLYQGRANGETRIAMPAANVYIVKTRGMSKPIYLR